MIDQIEDVIARKLADRHHYPFAQNIYHDIFKTFSHFPLKLEDVGVKGPGKTITFLALVVHSCLNNRIKNFNDLYEKCLQELKIIAQDLFPQDITVEVFLGCILYYYHPVDIRSVICEIEAKDRFTTRQEYEFDLKKKTILINAF